MDLPSLNLPITENDDHCLQQCTSLDDLSLGLCTSWMTNEALLSMSLSEYDDDEIGLRPVLSRSSMSSIAENSNGDHDDFQFDTANNDFGDTFATSEPVSAAAFLTPSHRVLMEQAKQIKVRIAPPPLVNNNLFAIDPEEMHDVHGPAGHSSSSPTSTIAQRIPSNPRYKTKVACVHCARHKLGCDFNRPCKRCIDTNKSGSCVDRPHVRRRRPSERARATAVRPSPYHLDSIDWRMNVFAAAAAAPGERVKESILEHPSNVADDTFYPHHT